MYNKDNFLNSFYQFLSFHFHILIILNVIFVTAY